jgi:hypothetical protein
MENPGMEIPRMREDHRMREILNLEIGTWKIKDAGDPRIRYHGMRKILGCRRSAHPMFPVIEPPTSYVLPHPMFSHILCSPNHKSSGMDDFNSNLLLVQRSSDEKYPRTTIFDRSHTSAEATHPLKPHIR